MLQWSSTVDILWLLLRLSKWYVFIFPIFQKFPLDLIVKLCRWSKDLLHMLLLGPVWGPLWGRDACKRQTTTCERGPSTCSEGARAWQRFHHTISYVREQHDFTACLYRTEESACNTIIRLLFTNSWRALTRLSGCIHFIPQTKFPHQGLCNVSINRN